MKSLLLTPLLAAAAVGVSACGSDDKPAESANASGSSSALTELSATREGLQAAHQTYLDGDKTAADEQVSEAYLQHFEHVEGPLEEKNHELTEELEDGIREHLRDEIKSGTRAKVEQRFDTIFADIEKAEAALR